MRNKGFRILMWIGSLGLFIAGVFYPLMSTATEIVGLRLTHSDIRLLDSVDLFLKEREYFIAGLIFIFAFVLPIVKYIEIAIRFVRPGIITKKVSRILHKLDKWSMLDVFIAAVLILNFKMNSNIVVMELKSGTTFLALSVVLRMLVVSFWTDEKLS